MTGRSLALRVCLQDTWLWMNVPLVYTCTQTCMYSVEQLLCCSCLSCTCTKYPGSLIRHVKYSHIHTWHFKGKISGSVVLFYQYERSLSWWLWLIQEWLRPHPLATRICSGKLFKFHAPAFTVTRSQPSCTHMEDWNHVLYNTAASSSSSKHWLR